MAGTKKFEKQQHKHRTVYHNSFDNMLYKSKWQTCDASADSSVGAPQHCFLVINLTRKQPLTEHAVTRAGEASKQVNKTVTHCAAAAVYE